MRPSHPNICKATGSPTGGCSPHLHLALEVQVHAKNQILWLAHLDRQTEHEDNAMAQEHECGGQLCPLCPLTDRYEEDVDHLFFSCQFSKRWWNAIGFSWDETVRLYPRLAMARCQLNLPFFTEIV
jgi:hypothetical protein